MSATIGHNGGPTFDDIVQENKDRGILLSMKETILQAVRDIRLERRHLRVLAEVIAAINLETGTAYPGRLYISDKTKEFGDKGYTEAGIGKTLSELVAFGYLVNTKRAAEAGGRALAHYTITKPPVEELQALITEFIMGQRRGTSRSWSDVAPDVTPARNVTSDVTSDVTPAGNVTPVGNVTSDVTYVDRTGTRSKELERENLKTRARTREEPTPLEGEEHVGHGVFVNGETVRHSAFAISLPGIRMNTINSGLTAIEVRQRCLAHALQWAVEIENGARPDKVLPTKIANFLARSIMGEANQAAVQSVRVEKARTGFGHGGRSATPDGQPVESEYDRTLRMLGGN